jgi:hypothetical protein
MLVLVGQGLANPSASPVQLEEDLLLLVAVLAQTFFTLVRRHLVSLMLFTVGHNLDDLRIISL